MKTKTITVAGINKHLKNEYVRQIRELACGLVHVCGYWVGKEEGRIHGDVVVAVTYSAAPLVRSHLDDPEARLILINTTFSKAAVGILRAIPTGKRVLLISEDGMYTLQCIKLLEEMGIDHIEILAYHSGMESDHFDGVDTAIYMGYAFCRPPFVKAFIDIGWRLITPESFHHILIELGVDGSKIERLTAVQRNRVATICTERIASIELDFAIRTRIQSVINAMPLGVFIVDGRGKIEVYNGTISRILGVNGTALVNRRVEENEILGEIYALLSRNHLKKNVYYYSQSLDRAFVISRNEAVFLYKSFQDVVMIEELDGRDGIPSPQRMGLPIDPVSTPRKAGAFKAKYDFEHIVAIGQKSRETVALAKKYAATDAPVLIIGQTGTGKELFAHAIHNASSRRMKPFVSINCGAIQDELLESELFGYEKGSFTGAHPRGKRGLLEVANGGTVFLDEVSDASMRFQVKLLRVLQEGEFTKVGGVGLSSIDIRIIAATNTSLKELKGGGTFRRDIFFRLSTFILPVPPLCERNEDIPALIERFLTMGGHGHKALDPELLGFFIKHPWEGNVRELRNCIEYACCLGGDRLTLEDLPPMYLDHQAKVICEGPGTCPSDGPFASLDSRDREILASIMRRLSDDRGIGRRCLTIFLRERYDYITEYAVRKYLEILESADFICKSQGRGGCKLGEMGRKWLFAGRNGTNT